MTPIFDRDVRLVGFFDGTHLFDLANEWVAFHERGQVFARGGRWLGPLDEGTFQDQDGRAVAWLAGAQPATGRKPVRPMNPKLPLHPKRPLRPRTPLPPPWPMQPAGGWSPLAWARWLGNEPSVATPEVDAAALRIEPITDADLDDFFRYLGEQLAENGRDGVYFQPMASTQDGVPVGKRQAFKDAFATAMGEAGWRRGWLARDASGRVCGHIDLRAHASPLSRHRCLLGMGVEREHRRIGLARRLLAHAEHWASEQGLQWIDLEVLSSNEPAVALYRREGFLMQGGKPHLYVIDGVSLGEISMAKKLSPPSAQPTA